MNLTNQPQNQFKIIAIYPHMDCDEKITKVLRNGCLYKFYQDYTFLNGSGIPVEESDNIIYCIPQKEVPEDLYTTDGLQVNISAVVGKNGCGKSTLIEILLYCSYFLGTHLKKSDGRLLLEPHDIQLEMVISEKEDILGNFKKDMAEALRLLTMGKSEREKGAKTLNKLLSHKIDPVQLSNEIDALRKYQDFARLEHIEISRGLRCSIYFEMDNLIWEFNTVTFMLRQDNLQNPLNGNTVIQSLNAWSATGQEMLKNFFYNIILNYSHHALNADRMGYWLNTLFHKNDGYKTPVVINPMRTEGYFKINTEIHLSKYRVLANLLIEAVHSKGNKISLTEKQYIHKVKFTYSPDTHDNKITLGTPGSPIKEEDYIISGPSDLVALIREIIPLYFENFYDELQIHDKNLPYVTALINYLAKKVFKIFKTYPEYNLKKKFETFIDFFRIVLPIIKNDNSHVTFKMHRTLFFLEKNLEPKNKTTWGPENDTIVFTLDELLEWMNVKGPEDVHLIFERMPPPIFDVDFMLDSSENHSSYDDIQEKNLPLLTDLSSGEQQKIYIINTVMYHLNNIYSVHNSSPETERIKYNYVNIVFDEIELYFHPDLQRRFINDFLETLRKYTFITKDPKSCIKAINILFSTHSPFILSDIPSQNILLLEYQRDIKASVPKHLDSQTFGANIHELLAKSFFFYNNTFIGEKANTIIKEIIEKIAKLKANDKAISESERTSLEKKISLIGEPFFNAKLGEMLSDIPNQNEGK